MKSKGLPFRGTVNAFTKPRAFAIVAVDALDERGAAALDRVAACAITPFLGRDVEAELAGSQDAKGDVRNRVMQVLPRGRQEAKAGDDLMRLSGKLLQHRLGLRSIGRLAIDA